MGCNGMVELSEGAGLLGGTASGCVRCVQMDAYHVRTMQTRASAPRTGVYVICTHNVRRTGTAGRCRVHVDFFADVVLKVIKTWFLRGTNLIGDLICLEHISSFPSLFLYFISFVSFPLFIFLCFFLSSASLYHIPLFLFFCHLIKNNIIK